MYGRLIALIHLKVPAAATANTKLGTGDIEDIARLYSALPN